MSSLWEKLQGFDLDSVLTDGHDLSAIRLALTAEVSRLRVVVLQTIKGYGVSFMENRMDSHYLPMTEEKFRKAIEDVDSQ